MCFVNSALGRQKTDPWCSLANQLAYYMSYRIVRDHVIKKRQRTEKQMQRGTEVRKGVGRTNGIVHWVRVLATKE